MQNIVEKIRNDLDATIQNSTAALNEALQNGITRETQRQMQRAFLLWLSKSEMVVSFDKDKRQMNICLTLPKEIEDDCFYW